MIWLDKKNLRITYVIVHSLNPAGAKNILAALPKAIQIPFAWTKKELMKIGLI